MSQPAESDDLFQRSLFWPWYARYPLAILATAGAIACLVYAFDGDDRRLRMLAWLGVALGSIVALAYARELAFLAFGLGILWLIWVLISWALGFLPSSQGSAGPLVVLGIAIAAYGYAGLVGQISAIEKKLDAVMAYQTTLSEGSEGAAWKRHMEVMRHLRPDLYGDD
jgi:hypothetical protein